MRLFAIWLGRVLANALAGGLAFAVVAALCLGFCGGVTGWFLGESAEVKLIVAKFGVNAGVVIGGFSGVFGLIIFAIVAAKSKSEQFFGPLQNFLGCVTSGQVIGIVTAVAITLVFQLANAYLYHRALSAGIYSNAFLILLGTTALMIGGAIAAAIFKRD